MALTPPPFNTAKELDPLAAICQDLGLGMLAPTISVVYDDFQLEYLEEHQLDGHPSTARDLHNQGTTYKLHRIRFNIFGELEKNNDRLAWSPVVVQGEINSKSTSYITQSKESANLLTLK